MMQRGQVDASKVNDMKQRGEVDNTKITTLEETPSLLSPSGRLSTEEMNRRMDEGAARMAEGSVSLAQIFRADKESTKKRVIKKAEKYLENPQGSVGFRSNLFTKWVEETKGIKTYQIKKEDKPEAVEEFLEFLNQ
jgi:hypothetical protein